MRAPLNAQCPGSKHAGPTGVYERSESRQDVGRTRPRAEDPHMKRAPRRALGKTAGGVTFSAQLGDFDREGVFLVHPSVDLEYSEDLELTLASGDGGQVRLPARVSAWV